MRRQAVTAGLQVGERQGRFLRRCREWRWQRGVAGKLHRGRPGRESRWSSAPNRLQFYHADLGLTSSSSVVTDCETRAFERHAAEYTMICIIVQCFWATLARCTLPVDCEYAENYYCAIARLRVEQTFGF
jgi:hypothetical protein